VLEVIQHQQQVPGAQIAVHGLLNWVRPRLADTKGVRERRQHEPRIAEWRQRHESQPVPEPARELPGHLQSQTGLPHARGPGEREHPGRARAEQLNDLGGLLVPPDQRGGWRGQLRPPHPPRRCGLQGAAGLRVQAQGRGEHTNRMRIRMPALTPFQGADRVGADPGALGKLLLGQP
jgi:hypothetical protein